jgi:hypothetical protein
MCLERWRKVTDVCDVIVRPPSVLLLTFLFPEQPENIGSMYYALHISYKNSYEE